MLTLLFPRRGVFTLFSFSFFFFFSFLRTIAVQARIVVKNNTRLFTRTQRERWQSKSERLLGTRLENRRNLESEEESKSEEEERRRTVVARLITQSRPHHRRHHRLLRTKKKEDLDLKSPTTYAYPTAHLP
tara:strand:+ start:740 stop:1132 length:393 start_codon:yes stop_codon:yes gene_type:complete